MWKCGSIAETRTSSCRTGFPIHAMSLGEEPEKEDEEGEVEVSHDESGDWRLASSRDSKREERM
jgi:hypothetical protein